jgi:hypothetical protein
MSLILRQFWEYWEYLDTSKPAAQTCYLTDTLFVSSKIPLLLLIFVSSPIVGLLLLITFIANTYFMAKKRTPAVEVNGSPAAIKKNAQAK